MDLPATAQKIHFAAPSGGINSVDAASEMPPTDAVYCFNLIRTIGGLETRSGFKEWVTGLLGGIDTSVRSIIPYSGSAANQTNDKLFAVTAKGIYDCTASGSAPTLLKAFALSIDPAGYGVAHAVTTPGGHFLVYCDEVNGPFLYTETTNTWTQITSGLAAFWLPSTQVAVGTQVINGNFTYTCTIAGVTNNTGPGPTGTGVVTDGTVTWNGVAGAQAQGVTLIGPSIADQNNGLYQGAASANLAGQLGAVTVWKTRLWLVEKDSTRAWYLPLNSLGGVATSFDFGYKMKKGGQLVNLYNWSFDGGSGPDTRLVAVSSAGDLVIFQGTDPALIGGFVLVGVWSLGAVPYGRRIGIEYGGDVLIASALGLLPLSKLIIGNPVVDRTVYDTFKISNLFAQQVEEFQTQRGWAIIIHPTDNCILVNVPQPTGWVPTQFAMAFSSRAWSIYRNLPMVSAADWNGQLYFGTSDGRVCVCQGGLDGVTLAAPTASGSAIQWSVLPAFKGADQPGKKVIQQADIYLRTGNPIPLVQFFPKLDYDAVEPQLLAGRGFPLQLPLTFGTSLGFGTWDNALWDKAFWGDDNTPVRLRIGGYGEALSAAAPALIGLATSPTTLIGVDVFYEPGDPF